MLRIPVQASPNQSIDVVLSGQQINLKIYTLAELPNTDMYTLYSHSGVLERFGTGNGRTVSFLLFSSSFRNIQGVDQVITIYSNGSPVSASVSNSGVVTFSVAPPVDAVLSFTGTYYYYNVMPAFMPAQLFMDVFLNNSPICTCVPCFNLNRIVRYPSSGFIGDLAFNDTQGVSDPTYDGLGSRYELIYLEASDL